MSGHPPTEMPVVESERLLFRPWKEVDFEGFLDIHSNEETARFIGGVCGPDDAWRRMATIAGHMAYQGHGLAHEAALTARQFVGQTLGWKTTISVIDLQIHPSRRLAARLGAVIESETELRGPKL